MRVFNLIFYFLKEEPVRSKTNFLKIKSNIGIFFIATFIPTLLKFFDIIFV